MNVYRRINNNCADGIRVKAFDLLGIGAESEKQKAKRLIFFISRIEKNK
jgi:hypothetical protein